MTEQQQEIGRTIMILRDSTGLTNSQIARMLRNIRPVTSQRVGQLYEGFKKWLNKEVK